jgi:hypothetical protein
MIWTDVKPGMRSRHARMHSENDRDADIILTRIIDNRDGNT